MSKDQQVAEIQSGLHVISAHQPSLLPDVKANILIVDDRLDKLLALEAVLSDLHQNIVRVHSGREALRQLLYQEFAVILLDVNMPAMDGFETAALIRQRRTSEHTPIIFVTAINDNETHVSRGYSLGAVDYILAPIVPEVLKTKVSVFVELFRKTELIRIQEKRLREMETRDHMRKLLETQDQLERETQRNRFFTLSIELLAIADFEGKIKQLNPTWERTFGFTEAELKSKSFLDFIPLEDRKTTAVKVQKLKQDGVPTYFESRFVCKDKSERWLGWTITPFASEGLLYLFARDITEGKNAAEEVELKNQRLEKFVRFTVNRELTMVRLKKEINELLKELGRETRYRV